MQMRTPPVRCPGDLYEGHYVVRECNCVLQRHSSPFRLPGRPRPGFRTGPRLPRSKNVSVAAGSANFLYAYNPRKGDAPLFASFAASPSVVPPALYPARRGRGRPAWNSVASPRETIANAVMGIFSRAALSRSQNNRARERAREGGYLTTRRTLRIRWIKTISDSVNRYNKFVRRCRARAVAGAGGSAARGARLAPPPGG